MGNIAEIICKLSLRYFSLWTYLATSFSKSDIFISQSLEKHFFYQNMIN